MMEYTARNPPIIDIYTIKGIGKIGRTKEGIINLGKAGFVSTTFRNQPSQKEETTFGELSRRQAKAYSDYINYQSPIITPGSLAVSLSRSGIRSSPTVSVNSSWIRSMTSSPKIRSDYLKPSSLKYPSSGSCQFLE